MTEDKQFSIRATGNHDVTVPGGTEVTVKDALVFERGGEVIGHVDAVYDFAKLDPSLHHGAINLLLKGRIRLVLATKERMERKGHLHRIYEEKQTAFKALPWYKKLFKFTPQFGVD